MNVRDQVVTVMTQNSGPDFGSEHFEKGYLISQASIRENTVCINKNPSVEKQLKADHCNINKEGVLLMFPQCNFETEFSETLSLNQNFICHH